jgi:hypothetical protein
MSLPSALVAHKGVRCQPEGISARVPGLISAANAPNNLGASASCWGVLPVRRTAEIIRRLDMRRQYGISRGGIQRASILVA